MRLPGSEILYRLYRIIHINSIKKETVKERQTSPPQEPHSEANLGDPDVLSYLKLRIRSGDDLSGDPLLVSLAPSTRDKALDDPNLALSLARAIGTPKRAERRRIRKIIHDELKNQNNNVPEPPGTARSEPKKKDDCATERNPLDRRFVFEKTNSSIPIDLDRPEAIKRLFKLIDDSRSDVSAETVLEKIHQLQATPPIDNYDHHKKIVRGGFFDGFRELRVGDKGRILFRFIDGELHIRTGPHKTIFGDQKKGDRDHHRRP